MDEKSDAQLLREYAECGNESGFHELVERHADLIYSSALRQMTSPDLARDVAQSVFTDLARKASTLSATLDGNASLLGWLYRSTRFAALTQLRDERRRHAREKHVMEYFNPASETAPDWERVGPVLDEAMADLSDEDREALLLRFFKNRDFRAIGTALGVNDDTAQKRVSRALEKLRSYLRQRNVTTSAVALSTTLSVNAVQAAPIGLSAMLSSAAITGTTVSAAGLIAAGKTLIMTTTQKVLITTVLAAAVGTGVYELAQNSRLRNDLQRMEQQLKPLTEQNEQLRRERDEMQKSAQKDAEQWKRQIAELPKLRGEVARLRQAANRTNDSTEIAMKAWLNRVAQLKEHLQQNPSAGIPELDLLDEEDWLATVKGRKLGSDNEYRVALSKLRLAAGEKFIPLAQAALRKFLEGNDDKFPTDITQLRDFFDPPVDEEILHRWQVASKKAVSNVSVGEWMITEKAPVDDLLDMRIVISKNGSGSADWLSSLIGETLQPVHKAYAEAHKDILVKFDPSRLLSYAITPEQKAAVQKLIEREAITK